MEKTSIYSALKATFIAQVFATMSFSVFYSTLVLYIINGLKLDSVIASSIAATFIALFYAFNLCGGFISGRFFTHRSYFIICALMQFLGYTIAAFNTINLLFWGLAFILVGSSFRTAINCLITQEYEPDDKRRETAFLWNYSAMNIGYMLGFILAGYFQLKGDYTHLFIISGLSNFIAIFFVGINWKTLKDLYTVNSSLSKEKVKSYALFGLLLLLAQVFVLRFLMKETFYTNHFIMILGVLALLAVIFLWRKQITKMAKDKMLAFIFLSIFSLIFWTLYLVSPIGLTLFIQNNVHRSFGEFTIAPQWVTIINAVLLILGGPIVSALYKRLRAKGYKITIPTQFTISLFCMALSFIILPLGIYFEDQAGFVGFKWVVLTYVLLTIGEILISPIGYAMVGQLIPKKFHSVMLGGWIMILGIGATLSNVFTKMAVGQTASTDPLITNPFFERIFNMLGWGAFGFAIIALLLRPFLHKLIKEE